MNQSLSPCTRRHFMVAAGSAICSIGLLNPAVASMDTMSQDREFDGLKIGLASYTTRKFSLVETISMMKTCGIHYLTLKDFHLKMDSTPAERKAAAQTLKNAGIQLMGAGVVYLKNDEKQIRNAFEYCRDAGMPVMVSAPDVEALPTVDRMVKEFDIKVAIHNHGPGDERYPSAKDAYRCAAEFDRRIGVCIDIGHSVRIGEDEIEVIHAVKDRLYDFHIKDVTERTPDGKATEVGRGVIDIPGILKALKEIKFDGHVALEYEKNENDPLLGMIESYAYMRGILAVI